MYGPIDPRDHELSRVLLHHSTRPKKGQVVYIHGVGHDTTGLCSILVEEAARMGAVPFLRVEEPSITRQLVAAASEDVMRGLGEFELEAMKLAKCYIGVRGSDNAFEMAGLDRNQLAAWNKHYLKPVHFEQRVKHTRWVVLRYPNSSMAQLAQKSRAEFAEFYYRACCVDYAHMAKAVEPLRELMAQTDQVRIVSPGTDLSFSIKGIGVVPCTGEHNIPDGECFTAPVKDSINGTVFFNTPTVYEGMPFDNIRLRFEKGRIVEASASGDEQTKRLNQVLDQDGARYVGEFAIGFHPFILHAMRDILFDEKVCGSFHMAMGQAYEEADNGNRSTVHWDMVQIQRADYGGGEIHFDGKVIRKDGLFTVDSLKGLNPDAYAAK